MGRTGRGGDSGDRLDRLDYYTLLGVEADATADRIRDAFHGFALRFHPDRHVGGPSAKVDRAAEIFRRGAEAYRVLLDPEARRRYDRGLAEGHLRFDPGADGSSTNAPRPTRGLTGALQVRSMRARPFASKAQAAIRKQDWKTAQLNLRIALQHEPDNDLLKARLDQVERELGA